VDLGLYMRVLWRFRLMVTLGILIAICLAFLSYARVSFVNGAAELSYRDQQIWKSETMLFVTQPGFPWGSAVQRYVGGAPETGVPPSPTADTSRLADLAVVYAQIAASDLILDRLRRWAPVQGKLEAVALQNPQNGVSLPLLTVRGLAGSPAGARQLAARGTEALQAYIERQQRQAGIAPRERAVLQLLNRPQKPSIVVGRSIARPLIVLLLVTFAVIGLAFILENLRPRLEVVAKAEKELAPTADAARRTA
jgi:hypothetical protein